MTIIGVTGNLSAGKTAVANILKKHGAVGFDADAVAKTMIRKGKPAHQALLKLFGREILLPGGQVDRKKLAERVFNNVQDLKKLNVLIHPGVIFEALSFIQKNKKKRGMLVLDVPLLFESKMDGLADWTLVVRSPLAAGMRRSEEKGISRSLAKKILSTQWPIAKQAEHADFVIDNDGSLKELEKKVLAVMKEINRVQLKGGI